MWEALFAHSALHTLVDDGGNPEAALGVAVGEAIGVAPGAVIGAAAAALGSPSDRSGGGRCGEEGGHSGGSWRDKYPGFVQVCCT